MDKLLTWKIEPARNSSDWIGMIYTDATGTIALHGTRAAVGDFVDSWIKEQHSYGCTVRQQSPSQTFGVAA